MCWIITELTCLCIQYCIVSDTEDNFVCSTSLLSCTTKSTDQRESIIHFTAFQYYYMKTDIFTREIAFETMLIQSIQTK